MPADLPSLLRERASQYLRTANAAHGAGDLDAAFENARTAIRLASEVLQAANPV